MKRESDRHIEQMTKSMGELATAQKESADSAKELAKTMHSIKLDTSILVDRKKP
jgi:hypothetical protein